MHRLLAVFALVLILVPVPASASRNAFEPPDRARLVRALITLQATDIDGRSWRYDDLRGRVVLVDFWATWCAPCLREMPYLKKARARYGERFEILGVSLDAMSSARLRTWLGQQGIDWPQIHARGAFDDRLARSFGIDRLPTNLLVGADGRVHAVNVRGDALFEALESLLD